jgi:hypothetical protein
MKINPDLSFARSGATMPDHRQCPAFDATVRTLFLSPSSA